MPGQPPLELFPRPRQVEVHGDGPPAGTPVTEERVADGRLPAEGFEIELGPDAAVIRHADAAGLRYGRATLDQVRRQTPGAVRGGDVQLPGLRLSDWPDLPIRGYMLDVSRDRVPTRSTLDRIVELMERARLNQLQLYTEHTFAYRDHETVWSAASPMTPADVVWLEGRCAAAGIELVPNQNCFGHMERWLRHDAYRHRAESPDGIDLAAGVHRPASVLAPTPDNARFVLDLLDELLPLFASRRVNIGCDETFELGRGASRADAERRGVSRVYVDHVKRLAGPLTAQGYEVLIWADMLRRDPSLADELPKGTTPVVWTYEAPLPDGALASLPSSVADMLSELGIDMGAHNGFAANVAPIAETGLPFWVAPGTSAWGSLVGRIDNAVANLLDAAEVGRATGARGYLVTDWGDNGHLQPPSISFGPLVLGGAFAWGLDANRELADDVPGALERWVFGPGSGLGATVDELGRLWRRTGVKAFNCSPLEAGLLSETAHLTIGEPDAAKVGEVVERLDAALAAIDRSAPHGGDGGVIRRELTAATRLARHGAYRLLARAGGPASAPAPAVLRADLAEAIELQSAAWRARSRPGGLDDSLARLRKTLATYD
jgi:hexosaminidase